MYYRFVEIFKDLPSNVNYFHLISISNFKEMHRVIGSLIVAISQRVRLSKFGGMKCVIHISCSVIQAGLLSLQIWWWFLVKGFRVIWFRNWSDMINISYVSDVMLSGCWLRFSFRSINKIYNLQTASTQEVGEEITCQFCNAERLLSHSELAEIVEGVICIFNYIIHDCLWGRKLVNFWETVK